ncbi:MAG: isoprenyl transferase [Acidaminococcales bacterium]|jgi:undecaprenyl diphosphate synthase|nr:isoprenyl transferase [Acidaminococcales bacterium]
MDCGHEQTGAAENLLDKQKIPGHIAVIMDGNGRWARQRGLPRTAGHKAGADALRAVARAAGELGVKAVTAYAFSTENWKRPAYEVNFLMNLLDLYLTGEINNLNKENVRVVFSGDIAALPGKVREKAEKTVKITAPNTGLTLNLAVNYGGQAEIVRAANHIIRDKADGKIGDIEITVDLFAQYLYTASLPGLDLLIRTGGDMRVSNFLLWQAAYAEICFVDVFWPDFNKDGLCRAIYEYQRRERRFGAIKDG